MTARPVVVIAGASLAGAKAAEGRFDRKASTVGWS